MGPVILKQAPVPSTSVFSDKRIVIDGQQRLTTLMIFLKVLMLKENNNRLFDRNYRLDDDSIQLLHGRNDKDAFALVVDRPNTEKIENTSPASQIISAFNYFSEKIDTTKIDRNIIQQYVQFVCIDLGNDEDEQQVFDTINSLGVKLTTAELLKNYFFNRENVREYDATWVNVFEKNDEARIYWDTEIDAGRNKRSMIDLFFDAFFQMFLQDKSFDISSEDKIAYSRLDKLSMSYQDFINSYCNGNKNIVLSKMSEYANTFYRTFRPEQCDMVMPSNPGIERINVIIFGLKTTTLIPYVLYIAQNVQDPEELNRMYRLLESYLMRRIVTHATAKNYNNLFLSLIYNQVLSANDLFMQLTKSGDATTFMPTDADLKHGFEHSYLVNLQTKGILYFIESSIRPSNSATALLGFNNYSLEHMLPKKWRNNWDSCANEELSRQRDNVLLTLGNLAIIPQSLNFSIRDGNWSTKVKGKGENKPGLEKCAAGIATMHDALQKERWDESEIASRANWLFEKAKGIWAF